MHARVSDCATIAGDLNSDVFIEHLKSASPVYTGLEGRIQFLNDPDDCGSVPVNAGTPNSPSLAVLFVSLVWLHVLYGQ